MHEKDDLTIRSLLRTLSLYADHRLLVHLYTALHQELGPSGQQLHSKP